MKTFRVKSIQSFLPQAVLVVSLLGIYVPTLAPGLSWANGGSDGGDLIAAAATNGVAHPTGYPLYLIVARLFQYLPIGTLAFRTNLMSAVFTCLAAVMVFSVVKAGIASEEKSFAWTPGVMAAVFFGLAPLIWSQALITEVYALQAFLTVFLIHLYTLPKSAFRSMPNQLDLWRGLFLGLAVSNHLTGSLLIPIALVLGSVPSRPGPDGIRQLAHFHVRKLEFDFAALMRQLLALIAGLTPYLILPLHALSYPPVNWGNPVNLQQFWWLVTGQLYQSYYLQLNLAESWEHLQVGAALLFQQFGLLGVVLGIVGLVVFGSRSRLSILTIWIVIMHSAFAVVYRTSDSAVYLIPAFLSFAIWVGFGVSGCMQQITRTVFAKLVFVLVVISYLAVRVTSVYGDVDAAHDLRAESFGKEILSRAPQNGIVFAKGDEAVFALWYFHFALRQRTDVAIVAVDLLHFDWYQENLQSTYPSLNVPGPFPWPQTIAAANPSRSACYVQYADAARFHCSEPLPGP